MDSKFHKNHNFNLSCVFLEQEVTLQTQSPQEGNVLEKYQHLRDRGLMFFVVQVKIREAYLNLCLLRLRTVARVGSGGRAAACSSEQTFQCSLAGGPSHTST